jgi:hypothetical protein
MARCVYQHCIVKENCVYLPSYRQKLVLASPRQKAGMVNRLSTLYNVVPLNVGGCEACRQPIGN